MSMRSCAVRATIFSNVSIIPPGFKVTELHALTLAARSHALLNDVIKIRDKSNLTRCVIIRYTLISLVKLQVYAVREILNKYKYAVGPR